MQVKNAKLQQEGEHLSSVKERLSLENQQLANELKVNSMSTYADTTNRFTLLNVKLYI